MKQPSIIFKFSFAELLQRADKVLYFLNRDLQSFNRYGYTAEYLTKMETTTNSLRNMVPDDYYAGQQKYKTQKKKEARKNLERFLGELKIRAKHALGEDSMDYMVYNFNKLSTINDKDLVTFTLHVHNTATGQLELLAPRNVDQTLLDDILSSRDALDKSIDEQQVSVSVRREMRFKRTQLANELYGMIRESCDIGKNIWKEENEAFYTDYIIYGSNNTIDEMEDLEEIATDETSN
ncbi:hypothetical protein DMA11_03230 [Marinilabiliaceae bacterium JC017]|nr:hypothetical protein DMA11_03230 [Marinilabiliaceae bacterium JC017]